MKKYIVVRHDNGHWDSIKQQFDSLDDAKAFVKLAALGEPGYNWDVFEFVCGERVNED